MVVVSSYPDEVVSRFEAAFEKAHPQNRLRIVWHGGEAEAARDRYLRLPWDDRDTLKSFFESL